MILSWFKGVNAKDFQCDARESAKHKRGSFPMSHNKSPFPFYLTRTNIKGLSRIPRSKGTWWFAPFIMMALKFRGFSFLSINMM